MFRKKKKKTIKPNDAEIQRVIKEILKLDSVKQLTERNNVEVQQRRDCAKHSITFQDANRIHIEEKLMELLEDHGFQRLRRHFEIEHTIHYEHLALFLLRLQAPNDTRTDFVIFYADEDLKVPVAHALDNAATAFTRGFYYGSTNELTR